MAHSPIEMLIMEQEARLWELEHQPQPQTPQDAQSIEKQRNDAIRAEVKKLIQWKHCMSYNDSYFGEPAGFLKWVVYQLERLLPQEETKSAQK